MMASIWKQPIFSDVFQSISSTVRTPEQGHLGVVAIVARTHLGHGTRMGAAGTPGGRDWPDRRLAPTVAPLQQDEHDAVDDKGDGHRPRVVEVLVEEVGPA